MCDGLCSLPPQLTFNSSLSKRKETPDACCNSNDWTPRQTQPQAVWVRSCVRACVCACVCFYCCLADFFSRMVCPSFYFPCVITSQRWVVNKCFDFDFFLQEYAIEHVMIEETAVWPLNWLAPIQTSVQQGLKRRWRACLTPQLTAPIQKSVQQGPKRRWCARSKIPSVQFIVPGIAFLLPSMRFVCFSPAGFDSPVQKHTQEYNQFEWLGCSDRLNVVG